MALLNYTTQIEAKKTVGEIQGILVAHGARSVLMNYSKDGLIESLSFTVKTPYGDMSIRLPVNPSAVLKVLEKQRVPPRYTNYAQAVRIAWRIQKDWVRAQMAYLETEMVGMEQLFLSYMITPNGKTLYEGLVERKFLLGEGNTSGGL